jgi:putative transposase
MARQPRFMLAGYPQHVIQRGNNRSITFVAEEDYRRYLEILTEACERFECDVHAYVLMTNHVHLLITPHRGDGICKVMQSLGRQYVQYFNYKYSRSGTLWEGRYKSTVLDSERYMLTCYRYIELNPVRADMVEHPSQYPWSSYGVNAQGEESDLVVPHELYMRLGATEEDRRSFYRELLKVHIGEGGLEEMREATNKAWVMGDDRFKQQIEKMTERQSSPKAKGGDRRSREYRNGNTINRV